MTTPSAAGLPDSEFPRPVSESLFAATARLEAVIASAPVLDPWCLELQAALTDCTLAVKYHLETLDGDDGMIEHLTREEPRLIYRLERLDAALKHLLPELGDACQSSAGTARGLIEPLVHLVTELRHAADDELEILHESLIPVGSSD
jgi:hypothetical protein